MNELTPREKIMSKALNDIINASRDDGLSAMCNWMRARAAQAMTDAYRLRPWSTQNERDRKQT